VALFRFIEFRAGAFDFFENFLSFGVPAVGSGHGVALLEVEFHVVDEFLDMGEAPLPDDVESSGSVLGF
jgi:hypothetical protein